MVYGYVVRQTGKNNETNRKQSAICGFVASASTPVNGDEAGRSERRQDAAGDRCPETPAKVRVVWTGRRCGTVLLSCKTAECSHCRHL